MRVVYFGSGAFGIPTLERLARRGVVSAVVTQPDRPAGRGGRSTPTPVGAWCAEHLPGVPVLKPERVSEPEMVAEIRRLALDGEGAVCFVVIAFGQKMPRELLDGVFAVNLHASLLPRWRGAAPINAAVLAGDRVTGNSVITLADRMDAGLVLGQTTRPIERLMTAGELHDLLAADGPELVERVLADWEAGVLREVVQDEAKVTKAGKMRKEDGWVRFEDGAEACRRRVHGYTPWPGVTVAFRGEPLKLLRVDAEDGDESGVPGEILDVGKGRVSCGGGAALRLIEVQPAGKRAMRWSDFANGHRVEAGERLEGGPRS